MRPFTSGKTFRSTKGFLVGAFFPVGSCKGGVGVALVFVVRVGRDAVGTGVDAFVLDEARGAVFALDAIDRSGYPKRREFL
jgi:hypothetical protein